MRATRAIIHLDNFCRNLETVRKKAGPHCKICVPLKADAYGHGAVPLARSALEAGAEYLAAAAVCEGAELRAAGLSAPVLLFSQALPEELPEIVSLNLIPFVSDREFIRAAGQAARGAGKQLEVHLKVDTGMGRMGCAPEEAAALAEEIASQRGLHLGGMATHLAAADSPESGDRAYTKKQLALFRKAVASVKEAGLEPGIVHAANSGALCFHEDAFFGMIRPGIFLYGYSPARGIPGGLDAEPVMEFQSAVVYTRTIKRGEAVSYGRTWIAPEDTCIGVIPAGYADGIPRLLSNDHSVLIRGKAYPLTGRICMDQCMVNLGTGGEVKRWDKAVIFGPGFVSAADIARKLRTIPYEITCNINKRVPRVYTQER
jgi:alanine racemase